MAFTTAKVPPGHMNPLGVVILAAGASSRMGRPKLLLPWGRTTIIGHLLSQWQGLAAAQIAVVLRADDAELRAELDRLHFTRTDRVVNPEPARGMFSSVVCAAQWRGWRSGITHWAIALGDQPHLRADTLRRLLTASADRPEAICQPVYGGKTAHPVLLPRAAFEALAASPAPTLKEFLKLVPGPRVHQEISDSGLALDLDTPADYITSRSSIKDA